MEKGEGVPSTLWENTPPRYSMCSATQTSPDLSPFGFYGAPFQVGTVD